MPITRSPSRSAPASSGAGTALDPHAGRRPESSTRYTPAVVPCPLCGQDRLQILIPEATDGRVFMFGFVAPTWGSGRLATESRGRTCRRCQLARAIDRLAAQGQIVGLHPGQAAAHGVGPGPFLTKRAAEFVGRTTPPPPPGQPWAQAQWQAAGRTELRRLVEMHEHNATTTGLDARLGETTRRSTIPGHGGSTVTIWTEDNLTLAFTSNDGVQVA